MTVIIEEWGYPMKSIVSAEERGSCINFSYENTVVPSPHSTTSWSYDYEGHTINLLEQSGDLPDSLEVIPAIGWQLMTDSPLVAPDWVTTVITVCQMLLG